MTYVAWYLFIMGCVRLVATMFRPDAKKIIEIDWTFRFGNALYYVPVVVFFVWFLFLSK